MTSTPSNSEPKSESDETVTSDKSATTGCAGPAPRENQERFQFSKHRGGPVFRVRYQEGNARPACPLSPGEQSEP